MRNIFNLKRGEILVAEYNDIFEGSTLKKDYIVFIGSGGSISIGSASMNYICYNIPVLACIDLLDNLRIGNIYAKLTIGCTIYKKRPQWSCIIRKPTFEETLELMNRLKENGYKYNRSTKEIQTL